MLAFTALSTSEEFVEAFEVVDRVLGPPLDTLSASFTNAVLVRQAVMAVTILECREQGVAEEDIRVFVELVFRAIEETREVGHGHASIAD